MKKYLDIFLFKLASGYTFDSTGKYKYFINIPGAYTAGIAYILYIFYMLLIRY